MVYVLPLWMNVTSHRHSSQQFRPSSMSDLSAFTKQDEDLIREHPTSWKRELEARKSRIVARDNTSFDLEIFTQYLRSSSSTVVFSSTLNLPTAPRLTDDQQDNLKNDKTGNASDSELPVAKSETETSQTSSNRKSQHKLKNVFNWVQRNGKRASKKYKAVKRKASLTGRSEEKAKVPCQTTQPRKRPSFLDVLNDKESQQAFRKFLVKEMSEENLDFWLEVENYKKQKAAKQEKIAPKIFSTYVASCSPNEVNVDSYVRKQTKENLQSPNVHTFDEAQKQIYKLMETDSFRRFSEKNSI